MRQVVHLAAPEAACERRATGRPHDEVASHVEQRLVKPLPEAAPGATARRRSGETGSWAALPQPP
ncbi:hypothetical protein, partial [Gemmatimonas sp.]|uniref:hypothetical protein n=1 Tax=Gemmatimonas sp. TaxID=1962908 RepID=UPI0037C0104F